MADITAISRRIHAAMDRLNEIGVHTITFSSRDDNSTHICFIDLPNYFDPNPAVRYDTNSDSWIGGVTPEDATERILSLHKALPAIIDEFRGHNATLMRNFPILHKYVAHDKPTAIAQFRAGRAWFVAYSDLTWAKGDKYDAFDYEREPISALDDYIREKNAAQTRRDTIPYVGITGSAIQMRLGYYPAVDDLGKVVDGIRKRAQGSASDSYTERLIRLDMLRAAITMLENEAFNTATEALAEGAPTKEIADAFGMSETELRNRMPTLGHSIENTIASAA